MASTDALPVPRKNAAFRATFGIFKNDGTLISGAAGLDSEVSKDGAAIADCTNEATEIGSTGIYFLDLTSGEMNADTVAVLVKSSTTDSVPVVLVFYPQEAGDIRADVDSVKGSSANATKFNSGAGSIEEFTVSTGSSTTTITTNLSSSQTDLYKGATVIFISGTLAKHRAVVTGYNGSTKVLTVNQMPTTPSNADTAIIV